MNNAYIAEEGPSNGDTDFINCRNISMAILRSMSKLGIHVPLVHIEKMVTIKNKINRHPEYDDLSNENKGKLVKSLVKSITNGSSIL